ncbi:AIPR family protein [Comamonas jiangduensis]|uniref:AIPR family protein n=1 Tax=Comamonas jiangduensis TaxID=1194168 RepID=UPI0028A6844B|nr:AIPR family protein [Comamonas jiangduensis]
MQASQSQIEFNNIDSNGWKQILSNNESFKIYGNNAIGLLALSLKFNIDDINYAGADSIVDGSNDKKNDFVYIDEENGTAVIIQAFFSKKPKQIASSNKASDLNTAIAWLLSSNEDTLPAGLRNHATRLRDGIQRNIIKKLHVWYVHNCTESKNVQSELDTVKGTLTSILNNNYPQNKVEQFVMEIGSSTLSEWYLQSFSLIYVTDLIKFECRSGFEQSSENWDAFITSISARELHFLYKTHKSSLFSANIRDYLGDRETDSNINSGIKYSIRINPSEFWAYNNGLTILTNSFEFQKEEKNLIIHGISIVNGAQTTGAIGNLSNPPKHEANILVRFIKVKNNSKTLIGNIVKYNNSQNKVNATDFRSNDIIQKRLIKEIEKIDRSIIYLGGRRGGEASAIKRNKNAIPSFTVSQALTAFHGDPINAYKKKSHIWTDDQMYSSIFNEKTTGSHIIFVYSLYKKIENIKLELLSLPSDKDLPQSDFEKINFFRKSGSIFVYIYALSQCMELFTGKAINDKFTLNFGNKTMDYSLKNWEPAISLTLPLVKTLDKGISLGLSDKNINQCILEFRQLLEIYFSTMSVTENRFTREIRFK